LSFENAKKEIGGNCVLMFIKKGRAYCVIHENLQYLML